MQGVFRSGPTGGTRFLGRPQQEQKEADRQGPENRQLAGLEVEKKDQGQEQAEHEPGGEYQPCAARVSHPAGEQAGGSNPAAARRASRRSASAPLVELEAAAALTPRGSTSGSGGRNAVRTRDSAPSRPSRRRAPRARPGSAGTSM